MRTMIAYDTASTTGVEHIPQNAKCVMGYPDGNFRSFPLLVRRFFPHAHCVSIGVEIGNLAAFSDIEEGNPINTPTLVRQDFERKIAHHIWKPGYYSDHGHMVDVILPGLSGIPRHEYRLILADWDGVAKVPDGYDGKQFINGTLFDKSVLNVDTFFPVPPPRKIHVHPKVAAGTISAALTTALVTLLNAHGVHVTHLTTSEAGAIVTAAGAIAGYLKRV
jgi:hypothetical protein